MQCTYGMNNFFPLDLKCNKINFNEQTFFLSLFSREKKKKGSGKTRRNESRQQNTAATNFHLHTLAK